MNLTGKCKKEFDKWYLGKTKYQFSLNYMELCNGRKGICSLGQMLNAFECSPMEMQYGVYVDFFDSVGMKIRIQVTYMNFFIVIDSWNSDIFPDRPKARTAAIEKANEIFNK